MTLHNDNDATLSPNSHAAHCDALASDKLEIELIRSKEQSSARQTPGEIEALDAQSDASFSTTDNSRATVCGFLRFCGSGFLAVVAFLDPGNLEADIQVGVKARYSLLWWLGLCTLLFAFLFQSLSARLGLVTGADLAQAIGKEWSKSSRILLWVLLEMSIVAADIQETVGCAIAVKSLSGGAVPLWAGCIIVSVAAMTLLQVDRLGYRHLEFVYAALIFLEAGTLVAACFDIGAPVNEVARGLFVPTLTPVTVVAAAGALGALVMPYNTFFASHVINGRPRHVDTDEKKKVVIRYASIEAFLVLLLSFFVNTCVVITFASFYGQDGSEDAGISSAGALLAAQSGRLVEMLFAIGLLSSGLVATLCLTYAGQVVMCGLLEIKVDAAWRLLATRLIALIPCLSLAVVFEATNTFDQVAQTINIIQSLVLPFGLIPVIHMSASKNIMGAWASKQWVLWGAATITLGIVGINVFTLVTLLMELPAFSSEGPEFIGSCVGFAFLILFYLSLVAYFSVGPPRWPCIISRIKSRVYGALNMAHRRFDPESMLEA